MFTFTDANDIEWAYEPAETVAKAIELAKNHFGASCTFLIGEIGEDNKVVPIEQVEVSYSNVQEWGTITHPQLGEVITYYPTGVPAYDSYTKPFVDNEGDICCYRFDHDEGCWRDETIVIGEYNGAKEIAL